MMMWAARRFKATTQSQQAFPVAPNRLEQDFTAAGPNQKWVADITYLWTAEPKKSSLDLPSLN